MQLKNFLLAQLFGLLFFPSVTFAQKGAFSLETDVFLPAIQAEYYFNPSHSIVANVLYLPIPFKSKDYWEYNNGIRAELNYRWYYNYEKRKARGELVARNNGNYMFAGMHNISLVFNDGETSNLFGLFGRAGWGFKRYIGNSNWYYGVELGISVPLLPNMNQPAVLPHLAVRFGYRIYDNSKKRNHEVK